MAERICVVQIISGFAVEGPSGGLGRSGIALSRALDRDCFQVVVCGLWGYGTPQERERIDQLNTEGLEAFSCAPWEENAPYQSFWRSVKGMQARLAGTRVDILHSHSEFGDGAALLLKSRLGAKIVSRTVHNQEWKKRPLRRIYLTHILYPMLFNLEIGVSQAIVDQLNARPLARLPRRQAQLVHPAFDFSRFRDLHPDTAGIKRSLNLPPNALIVGTVGRLMKQKGYSYLVQAAERVARVRSDVHFLVIGEGELGPELKALAGELGVSSKITFAGRRSDVEELLTIMDLFVSTSLWEGLPGVILESMASGVPVLATDIQGTREIIQDRVNGWLVPPGDPAATADAILELLGKPDLMRSMAGQALSTPDRYSIGAVAARYKTIYMDLLRER